jgi:hypothetical protein
MSAYGSLAPLTSNREPLASRIFRLQPRNNASTRIPWTHVSTHHLTLSTAPAELVGAMYAEFAAELERDEGRTYPQEPPMSRGEFEAYFFARDVIVGIGEERPGDGIEDGQVLEESAGGAVAAAAAAVAARTGDRGWADVIAGFYYVRTYVRMRRRFDSRLPRGVSAGRLTRVHRSSPIILGILRMYVAVVIVVVGHPTPSVDALADLTRSSANPDLQRRVCRPIRTSGPTPRGVARWHIRVVCTQIGVSRERLQPRLRRQPGQPADLGCPGLSASWSHSGSGETRSQDPGREWRCCGRGLFCRRACRVQVLCDQLKVSSRLCSW